MKVFHRFEAVTLFMVTVFCVSCGSPSTSKKEKGTTIQDTSMPGQQNDGYPYTNPTSRMDTLHADSVIKKDTIIKK